MSQYNVVPVVSEEEYEVECVRDSRIIDGVEQFLIKWAGIEWCFFCVAYTREMSRLFIKTFEQTLCE